MLNTDLFIHALPRILSERCCTPAEEIAFSTVLQSAQDGWVQPTIQGSLLRQAYGLISDRRDGLRFPNPIPPDAKDPFPVMLLVACSFERAAVEMKGTEGVRAALRRAMCHGDANDLAAAIEKVASAISSPRLLAPPAARRWLVSFDCEISEESPAEQVRHRLESDLCEELDIGVGANIHFADANVYVANVAHANSADAIAMLYEHALKEGKTPAGRLFDRHELVKQFAQLSMMDPVEARARIAAIHRLSLTDSRRYNLRVVVDEAFGEHSEEQVREAISAATQSIFDKSRRTILTLESTSLLRSSPHLLEARGLTWVDAYRYLEAQDLDDSTLIHKLAKIAIAEPELMRTELARWAKHLQEECSQAAPSDSPKA